MSNFINDINLDGFQAFLESLKSPGWTGADDENEFLNFLLNYVHNDESRSISSETIAYQYKEFKRNYLHLLSSKVSSYAEEYHIEDNVCVDGDDIFIKSSYALKIKDQFYLIQYLVGQGTLVYFEYLEDVTDFESYVDYDLMMRDEIPASYEEDLKRHKLKIESTVFDRLDELRGRLKMDDESFIQLLHKYAQNRLKGGKSDERIDC